MPPARTARAEGGLVAHAWLEIEFVMEYDHIGWGEFVKPHRLAHRLTGQVHKGLGF